MRLPPVHCANPLQRLNDIFAFATEIIPNSHVLRLMRAAYLWHYDVDRVTAANLVGELAAVLRDMSIDIRHHFLEFAQRFSAEGQVFADIEKAGR